jgi:DNA-directed RNA polymerase subunit M/transcription elongation factor TFIIS
MAYILKYKRDRDLSIFCVSYPGMPTLSTVLLSIKGDVRKANLQLNENSNLTMDIIQKYFKKKDEPEMICYYEWDSKIIFIFGYKKGKKGTENKIELPDPHSDTVIFGDALAIYSLTNKWESPLPFTIEQWNTFYNGIVSEEADIDEDEEDDEVEEDEEELSEKEEEFEEELDITTIIEEEEEPEEILPVKKKRATAYTKVDTSGLKEEIDINSEPEPTKLRMLCMNSLMFLEKLFSKEQIRQLEKGIFENAFKYAQKNHVPRCWKSPIFIEIYRQNVRAIISNIHPDSPVKNPRLLSRILDGEFTLYELPSLTSYEMFPEKWFELRDKQLQREQKILEGNKSRATDQFKCRRCNKRECTYYELQTRSADEPMTIFITCLNCGKEWRNGG